MTNCPHGCGVMVKGVAGEPLEPDDPYCPQCGHIKGHSCDDGCDHERSEQGYYFRGQLVEDARVIRGAETEIVSGFVDGEFVAYEQARFSDEPEFKDVDYTALPSTDK